jgi:hypothetical protein
MLLFLFERAYLFELLFDYPSAFESLHAFEKFSTILVYISIVSEKVNEFQLMSMSTLIVIGVVGRRDFDSASSEFPLHKIVSNYN